MRSFWVVQFHPGDEQLQVFSQTNDVWRDAREVDATGRLRAVESKD